MRTYNKTFIVSLYGKDDIEVRTWKFHTKRDQVRKYNNLIACGYDKNSLEKRTLSCG